MQIQFKLRTAFVVLTIVAIGSELIRWMLSGKSPFFIGLTAFGAGGVAGVAACLFVALLGITATREFPNQRRAFIFAGFCGWSVWVYVLLLGTKMPLLLIFCCAASVVMFIGVRTEMSAVEFHSDPEVTLGRLKATKSDIRAEIEDIHNEHKD